MNQIDEIKRESAELSRRKSQLEVQLENDPWTPADEQALKELMARKNRAVDVEVIGYRIQAHESILKKMGRVS